MSLGQRVAALLHLASGCSLRPLAWVPLQVCSLGALPSGGRWGRRAACLLSASRARCQPSPQACSGPTW